MAMRKRQKAPDGAALLAVLEPLKYAGPLDWDVQRFCRLSELEAAEEVTDALYTLPEIRRYFAYRLLKALTRAVLAGGGFHFNE